MRSIKFRVWVPEEKRMFGNEDIAHISLTENYIVLENGFSTKLNLCRLMQYTGVQDTAWEEIYEGDIMFDGMYRYAVVFYGGAWRLKRNVDGDEWWKSLYRYTTKSKFEIVGNIYENPELIKEEK